MIQYLQLNTDSLDYARALSAALWSITRPERTDADTQYYSSPIVHPETGMIALPISDEAKHVHPLASAATLLAMVQITEAEASDLTAALESAKGGHVRISDLLPASWSPALLSREAAAKAGWFAQPETEDQ